MTRISVRDRNSEAQRATAQRVTLRVDYDGREAYIELPLYGRERSPDACQRELELLLEALDQWENELGEVSPRLDPSLGCGPQLLGGGYASICTKGDQPMSTTLITAVLAVFLIASASTALAQKTPINTQSPTVPVPDTWLDTGPFEN